MGEKPFPVEECSTCHAPIIWAITERDKRAPFDAEPAAGGTAILSWSAGETAVHSRILRVAQREGRTDLRLSHFATCPDAAEWRSRTRVDPSTRRIARPATMAGQSLLWAVEDEA